jgi:hypothetical protein
MEANRFNVIMLVIASLMLATQLFAQDPVSTAFTYQGQLKEGGVPADGVDYDFRFRLFDDPAAGTQVGDALFFNDQTVENGLFTLELDFGAGIFTGDALWLEVGVKRQPLDPFTVLSPRQPLDAAPYALYALDAGSAGFWAASANDIYNTNSGNVGIGTTTPSATLEVANEGNTYAIQAASSSIPVYAVRNSTTGSEPAIHGESGSGTAQAAAILGVLTNETPGSGASAVRGHVPTTSAFGIGVWGDHDGDGWGLHGTSVGGSGVYGSASASSGTTYGVRGRAWSPEGCGVYGYSGVGTGVYGSATETSGTNYGVRGNTASPDGYAGYFTGGRSYFEGNVGIGAENPSWPLTIYSDTSGHAMWTSGQVHLQRGGTALKIIHGSGGDNHSTEFDGSHINSVGAPFTPALNLNTASSGNVLIANGGGNVGIGTTSPAAKLDVAGTARAEVVEITGADVAEKFPVSEDVRPGMVVAIDPGNPGQLCLARGVHNRCVAGVVSGANGLSAGAVLGNLPGQENSPPVALSGRVWVYCDATDQPIAPGDLLTTSDTPGHAMKVTDHSAAQGAILGKAMTSLEEGRGLVLVLVSLQ